MSFSFRIFLGLFLIIGFAAYLFFATFITELKPGFRQSTEESLVDIANLLATLVSSEVQSGNIENGHFAESVKAFQSRRLHASIWNLKQQHPGIELYITNANGIITYDSRDQHQPTSNIGADYSRWNDIYLTLRGEYGVRSTLADPENKFSSVMHVAAPIRDGQNIIGVITVMKQSANVRPFLLAAQKNLARKGALLLFAALIAGLILAFWLSRSIKRLADYANAIKHGNNQAPPDVSGTELKQLASAMAAMKTELEGKQYVENYVQNLTHQLKTPIASIQGAAELISEDMSQEQRQRFIDNIIGESKRLEDVVQYLLSLAAIENRDQLIDIATVDMTSLCNEILQSYTPVLQSKGLILRSDITDNLSLLGEQFLLHQAISNLLDNAIEHSPEQGAIDISLTYIDNEIHLLVRNLGSNIPDFAMQRLFERFILDRHS